MPPEEEAKDEELDDDDAPLDCCWAAWSSIEGNGTTLVAGDATRSPLTVTRPVEIRSSAARREARPESAIALASQTFPSLRFSEEEVGVFF